MYHSIQLTFCGNCVLLQCIELLGANCFTPEQYSKLVDILRSHMETRFTNEKQRQEKRKDEDYDEEVEEVLEEEVS